MKGTCSIQLIGGLFILLAISTKLTEGKKGSSEAASEKLIDFLASHFDFDEEEYNNYEEDLYTGEEDEEDYDDVNDPLIVRPPICGSTFRTCTPVPAKRFCTQTCCGRNCRSICFIVPASSVCKNVCCPVVRPTPPPTTATTTTTTTAAPTTTSTDSPPELPASPPAIV